MRAEAQAAKAAVAKAGAGGPEQSSKRDRPTTTAGRREAARIANMNKTRVSDDVVDLVPSSKAGSKPAFSKPKVDAKPTAKTKKEADAKAQAIAAAKAKAIAAARAKAVADADAAAAEEARPAAAATRTARTCRSAGGKPLSMTTTVRWPA